MRKTLFALAMVAAFSVSAFGAHPSSILGTWTGFANQTAVQLVIITQGTTGACQTITGTFSNVPSGGASNIVGFYCPSTGRVAFVRNDITTNDTFQSYSANVSATGITLRMGGIFAQISPNAPLGEYNFAVSK